MEWCLHAPAVVLSAKLITKPCALIGAPRPWLTTEALSVGGNDRLSPITTAISIRDKKPLMLISHFAVSQLGRMGRETQLLAVPGVIMCVQNAIKQP